MTTDQLAVPEQQRTLRGGLSQLKRYALPATPFAALVAAWYLVSVTMHPTLAKLPTIAQVWSALVDMIANGQLGQDIRASLFRYVLGIAVGVVSGLVLGVLAGRVRPVALLLEPLATFFTAVSGVAWIPLAILWFGIGTGTVVFVIWNTVFFLVFANTLLGVRSNKVVLEEAVRTLGGGPLHIIRSVVFPGALPYILVGVRAGLGFGWRALIAAEIIGSSQGLGAMIFTARESYRTDMIVAGIVVVAFLSVITEVLIFIPLQRRTVERWGMQQAGGGK